MSIRSIEARNVRYSYQEGTLALDCIDFFATQGEFVALLASNGSGKTTLLRILVGLMDPLLGEVELYGAALRKIPKKILYQKIGMVLQNPSDQLFAATVEEDVAYGPRNLGLPEEEVQIRVANALESVAAFDLRKRAIHHLSFGEQKRVCVAGVLAMKPSILILDEPTAGLDPAGETLMMRLLNRLNREEGITIILATHSVDLLPLFADRIYVLQRGKVLKQGPADVIFRDHDMIQEASLRLPYVAALLHRLKQQDGVPINGLPLTLGEARQKLLELIPEDIIIKEQDFAIQ